MSLPSGRIWTSTAPEDADAVARSGRAAQLAAVVVVGLFALHAMISGRSLVDDAYISFRYARNLAHGHGLVFNEGDRVEGYTNFSWVILSALAMRAGADPAWLMPLVGIAAGMGLVVFVWAEARSLASAEVRPHPFAGVPAACIVAASPSLAFYSGSGLETSLYALLATIACVAIARRRARTFALATAAAFLTRPEAGLLGALGLITFIASRDMRRVWTAASILSAVVVPYLLFKSIYFGSITPNTLAAKPPQFHEGLLYVGSALPEIAGILLIAMYAALLPPQSGGTNMKNRTRGVLLALWVAQVVAVVFEGGDWMAGQRLLVPALGTLAVATDRALVDLVVIPRRWKDTWKTAGLLLVLANLPLAAWDTRYLAFRSASIAESDEIRAAFLGAMHGAGVRSIGTNDIGLPGYLLPDVRILDLAGLTDKVIGHAPGPHMDKQIPLAYLTAHAPDAFLILSRVPPVIDPQSGIARVAGHYAVEKRVIALPWFQGHYQFRKSATLGVNYYLSWFQRLE